MTRRAILKMGRRERAKAEVVVKRLVLFIVVLAVAGQLVANELDVLPGKWWEDERIANHMELTDEQREQIRDIVFEHARLMIDLKADFDKADFDDKAEAHAQARAEEEEDAKTPSVPSRDSSSPNSHRSTE